MTRSGRIRAATWACCTAAWLPVLLPVAIREAAAQALPANPPLPPVAGARAGDGPRFGPAPGDGDGLPPYEPQLERLAERLGTLALLRGLCADGDAADYRDRMAALLDAEGQGELRRSRLAGAFNRGVEGYAVNYRRCTASARLVIARALAEADRLTRDLAARYGGS